MSCTPFCPQTVSIRWCMDSTRWRRWSRGIVVYTLSVQNIKNTFLILSCTLFCPQNSLNLSGHGFYNVWSVPQGCWPMLTPMLPTVVPCWLDVLWVVDHSWYTQETFECEKPSSVAVLDTLKPVRLAPTTIPRSMALKSFVLPNHPLNVTYTQSISQLSQSFKILLSPVYCPLSKLIEVDLTNYINKGS